MVTKSELIDALLRGWNDVEQMGRNAFFPAMYDFATFVRNMFGKDACLKEPSGPLPGKEEEYDIVYVWNETLRGEAVAFRPDYTVAFRNSSDEIHLYVITA